MSTNTWPRSNAQSITSRPGGVSAKSLFLRSRNSVAPAPAKTPIDHQPSVPIQIMKQQKPRHSVRRNLNRIQKNKESEKQHDSRADLAEKFSEGLEQYRENLHNQADSDLDDIDKNLNHNLEELSVNIETHLQKLSEIEEPLQKPFVAEALTKVQPDPDAASARTHGVLLQDSISEFRTLYEEKGNILRKLWLDWEDAQFEIMRLAVEIFGKDSISVIQLQNGTIEPGQQERLDDMLQLAEDAYDESHQHYAEFWRDLKRLDERMGQISSRAKQTAADMHQSQVQKQTERVKQITDIIRQTRED